MKKIMLFVILVPLFLLTPLFSDAARLYVSPANINQTANSTFSVSVFVDTQGQVMNASSGTISFPSNLLEVTSISKANSIISLWVQEPTFSNTTGTIQFEGIVLNPGFSGASGRVLTVNFRTKQAGAGSFSFVSGSVLANDGIGTNIVTSLSPGSFAVAQQDVAVPPIESGMTAPVISSSTHPDESSWYSSNEVMLRWNVPSQATEVRTVIGRNPANTPNIVYSPPITQRTIADLGEGTYHFAVQYKTPQGSSVVGRFVINIDMTSPESFVVEKGLLSALGNPTISLNAKDNMSGISHYRIMLEDGQVFDIFEESVRDFELFSQQSGLQKVSVEVYDNAGNMTESFVDIEFENETAMTIRPVIESIPEEVSWREYFLVKGYADPQKNVRIHMTRGLKTVFTFETKTDDQGQFVFVVPTRFSIGFHTLVVEYVDFDGSEMYRKSVSSLVDIQPSKIAQIAFDSIEYFVSGLVILLVLVSFIKIVMYVIVDMKGTFRFFRKRDDDEY